MSAPIEVTAEVAPAPTGVVFTGWMIYDPADPEYRFASLYVSAEGSGIKPFRPTPVDPMRLVAVRVTVPVDGAP